VERIDHFLRASFGQPRKSTKHAAMHAALFRWMTDSHMAIDNAKGLGGNREIVTN